MAAYRVDSTASPDFKSLCDHWRTHGFPSVDRDTAAAFGEIAKNHEACRGRRVQRFEDLLADRFLLKYRYRDSARREGARGGWRILAILDPPTKCIYPIMVYPKKAWEMPSGEDLRKCVSNLSTALRQLNLPGANSPNIK